jgi:hypothetical protein
MYWLETIRSYNERAASYEERAAKIVERLNGLLKARAKYF